MKHEKSLGKIGLKGLHHIFWDEPVSVLVEEALHRHEGCLAENGALVVETGAPSGRSPKDKYLVKTRDTGDVWWGSVNRPLAPEVWDRLMAYARSYLQGREVFVFNGFAGADPDHRLQVRVIAERAWHALFARTLFIVPKPDEVLHDPPDFTVLNVCGLKALDYKALGLNSGIFVVINFAERMILIGGTNYAGEIKKSIFTVLNYLLPKKGILPMHCSANVGKQGDTALFFGLSGTGKTTLSADPDRRLIGDDEHGWTNHGVFNFEGGCYAKCIKLSRENEPQIYNALRFGSVLENVILDDRRCPDFDDGSLTENTRATYPVAYIDNCVQEGMGGHPKNIFFLAADAFGVLPPIARLSSEQAMYHFLSGYTAKLAGTEAGVVEPTTTFSACFGAPFLVHHPFTYAQMLGEKMRQHDTRLWLVNTGWSGGGYGIGKRMKIGYTRALLSAALSGALDHVGYVPDPVFGLQVPQECPGVPADILQPRNTWTDKGAYDRAAADLARKFVENFKAFEDRVAPEVIQAGPRLEGIARAAS
ncbi:MAG: Phosphoenolpyruvate carboxykinase [ATP] [Candidatus Ozemobacter sibiricus]|uniref:Phosphoenolpyruvate carboxykinase (ATP) n=1 Tax=Candidatus Ozemobacter sibiricus TaxID=2268124 RepID=A0A367ZWR9_9BACT|nr:MAG: Phosphoenolpyruvate carboxykinase [ATP] [Candidatus Ozemobacter sibiricus]